MEGTNWWPQQPEDNAKNKEDAEKQKAGKKDNDPGMFGKLAVGSEPEQPSALEAAWARIKGESRAEENPTESAAEEAPAVVPETVLPASQRVETEQTVPDSDPIDQTGEETVDRVHDRAFEDDDSDTRHDEALTEADPDLEEAQPAEAAVVEVGPAEVPAKPIKLPEVRPVDDDETPQATAAVETPDEIIGLEPELPAIPAPHEPEAVRQPAPVMEVGPEPEPAESRSEEAASPLPQAEGAAQSPETVVDSDVDEEELRIDHGREEDDSQSDEQADESQIELSQPDPPEQPDPRPFEFKAETGQDSGGLDQAAGPEQPVAEQESDASPEDPHSTEHLGHMLLDEAESDEQHGPSPVETTTPPEIVESSRSAEEKMKVETAPKGPVIGRHVETLNQAELISIATEININGNNLRHIYETHLIGEQGLRRLVAEYQQGGDMSEALRRELLEHEIDFERDPAMRDIAPSAASPLAMSVSASDDPTLEELLRKADASTTDSSAKGALPKAPTDGKTAGQQHQAQQYRMFIDIGFFTVIGILVVLVVIIYLKRG